MFNRCLININQYLLILLQIYGRHLSHLFEKPSISIGKINFLMQKSGISIEKTYFFEVKTRFGLKN